MFAVSDVDRSVARLLFAGLFTYDGHNRLVGDLAKDYVVDEKGTTYTVHLKPDLRWQDGRPLTADDVVFTYQTIQNPDVQSPLAGGWQGIKISKLNSTTVVFSLTNPLAAFPFNLTNGIVPQHLLSKYSAQDLRSAAFNTVKPVGAGPFKWNGLQVKHSGKTREVLASMIPFEQYSRGAPKVSSIIVHSFPNEETMIDAFSKQQINGMVGLHDITKEVTDIPSTQVKSLVLTAANMAFFNTTNPILNDPKVRQALVSATDVPAIVSSLGYATRIVDEPFLSGQLGYSKQNRQLSYDQGKARQLLTEAGWTEPAKAATRIKNKQPLHITLYASDKQENKMVTRHLKNDWEAVGADVDVQLKSDDLLQSTVNAQSYDVLLFGISIGVDPDVFVYWHSSQIDPRSSRLNFSLYNSKNADAALDAGRTRIQPELRVIKYKPFLEAWQQDAPAVGLYQPRFAYVTNEKVFGLDASLINTPTDRFNNVQNWQVRTAKVTND